MATNKEEIIAKNAEAIEVFASLEKLSREQPEIFQFFLNKYGTQMLDYYDWGALWRNTDQQVGILDKFMPYIGIAMSLIILIAVIVKK